ncbi:hypothetical protein [Pseudophaeobacter sp.]|uniref:hypothetical protein n=2 Tax=Pseudophaeobacter sp. TaxID=1971739 RepID=UPI00405909BD
MPWVWFFIYEKRFDCFMRFLIVGLLCIFSQSAGAEGLEGGPVETISDRPVLPVGPLVNSTPKPVLEQTYDAARTELDWYFEDLETIRIGVEKLVIDGSDEGDFSKIRQLRRSALLLIPKLEASNRSSKESLVRKQYDYEDLKYELSRFQSRMRVMEADRSELERLLAEKEVHQLVLDNLGETPQRHQDASTRLDDVQSRLDQMPPSVSYFERESARLKEVNSQNVAQEPILGGEIEALKRSVRRSDEFLQKAREYQDHLDLIIHEVLIPFKAGNDFKSETAKIFAALVAAVIVGFLSSHGWTKRYVSPFSPANQVSSF